MSQEIEKSDQEPDAQPLEGMIKGGELNQDKKELQQIIERNKGQVEALDEAVKEQGAIEKRLSNQDEPKNFAAVENVPSIKEKEDVRGKEDKIEKSGEIVDGGIEIPRISKEKRKEILEGLEGKIEEAPFSKDDNAKNDQNDRSQDVEKHAKEVVEISDPEQQIEKIVQLAISKDPYHAIKVAQHLDNNYILDKVHDELVEEKVIKELIKKGLLKEI